MRVLLLIGTIWKGGGCLEDQHNALKAQDFYILQNYLFLFIKLIYIYICIYIYTLTYTCTNRNTFVNVGNYDFITQHYYWELRVAWLRVPGKAMCMCVQGCWVSSFCGISFLHHLTCLLWHLLPCPWLWFPWLQQAGPLHLQTDAILYSEPQCHRLALDSFISTL